MGLFISFGKGKGKNKNSVGEDLDRLTPKGELPFGWMAYNKELVQKMDDEWFSFRLAIDRTKDPAEQYAAIKSYLLFLEDGKKHYYEVNVCAGKYFEEYIYDSPYNVTLKKRFKDLEKQLKKK